MLFVATCFVWLTMHSKIAQQRGAAVQDELQHEQHKAQEAQEKAMACLQDVESLHQRYSEEIAALKRSYAQVQEDFTRVQNLYNTSRQRVGQLQRRLRRQERKVAQLRAPRCCQHSSVTTNPGTKAPAPSQ